MSKSEPNWSPWGQKKKQTVELLKSFGRQCRLLMEAELQNIIAVEREKVLCDLAVHAEFISQWLEASQAYLLEESQSTAQTAQSVGFLLPQDQQVPDSYMARALRSTTRQQVQQVLRMTPREWADEMTSWFAEVMVQMEFLTRPDQAPAAAGANNQLVFDSSFHGALHKQQQQQQQQSQTGRAPSYPGTAMTSGAAAASCAHAAAGTGTSCAAAAACDAAAAAAPGAAAAPSIQRSNSSGAWSLPRSTSSGSWSLQQCPINVSPAHARETMLAVITRGTHIIITSTLLGRMIHVAGEAILTGGTVDSGFENGEAITDGLQLTELQQLHLYICMEELERMNSSVVKTGSELLQLAAQPTLQLAAATQSSPQRRAKQRGQGAGDGSDPSELAADLECQLQRVSSRLHRNMVGAMIFITNTLSTHQMTVLFVACYPRIASAFGVANVARKRVQQHKQALLLAVDRTARHTGTIPTTLVEHSQAGFFALCGRGHNSAASSSKGSDTAAHSGTSVAGYMLLEHEQQRMAQLLRHQKVCWEQLGCQSAQELS